MWKPIVGGVLAGAALGGVGTAMYMNRPSSSAIAESSHATFNPVISSNPVYSGALVPNTFWSPTQTYDQFPDVDIAKFQLRDAEKLQQIRQQLKKLSPDPRDPNLKQELKKLNQNWKNL